MYTIRKYCLYCMTTVMGLSYSSTYCNVKDKFLSDSLCNCRHICIKLLVTMMWK